MRELANVNYQKELEKLIEQHEKEGKVPRLFLHACCAPCSSYVLEYLSRFFSVTVFFYNPNISPKEEYEKRVAEIRRLISEMEFLHPVDLVEGAYRPEDFYAMAKGLEDVPEGGERCFKCYRLRMEAAAKLAQEGGYDYFTTTAGVQLPPDGHCPVFFRLRGVHPHFPASHPFHMATVLPVRRTDSAR